MKDSIVNTWQIHNRINLYLLDAVQPENLASAAASKGRTVGEQFAHLHNVRLMWLKASFPPLLDGLNKVEKPEAVDKALLKQSLSDSAQAIEELLKKALETDGKIKGFKPDVVAYLGYLISHESHHRGQIVLSLKQAGFPVEKKISYGLWEWGTR
ncbi:MAG TPA: DinB family protein [Pyrinomonadaceae bacterium]